MALHRQAHVACTHAQGEGGDLLATLELIHNANILVNNRMITFSAKSCSLIPLSIRIPHACDMISIVCHYLLVHIYPTAAQPSNQSGVIQADMTPPRQRSYLAGTVRLHGSFLAILGSGWELWGWRDGCVYTKVGGCPFGLMGSEFWYIFLHFDFT